MKAVFCVELEYQAKIVTNTHVFRARHEALSLYSASDGAGLENRV
jgi:hypothetical protein